VQLVDLHLETFDIDGMYHGNYPPYQRDKCSFSIDPIISKNEPRTGSAIPRRVRRNKDE